MLSLFNTTKPELTRPSSAARLVYRLCAAVICITSAFNTANAATYYLDAVNGSDINPGTSTQPWKTLTKAQAVAVGGDTVYLRSGNYGAFTDFTSVRTDWITYKAVAGHTPVFTYIDIRNAALYLAFDGITVTPGNISGTSYNRAVFVYSASYVKFDNCRILGPGLDSFKLISLSHGFKIQGSTHVSITNCYVDNYQYGIDVLKVTSTQSEDVDVTSCEVKNCQYGITTLGHRINVRDNTVHNIYSDGIIVASDTGDISHNDIHDIERSVNYTVTGTFAYTASSHTITGNGSPFADWMTATAGYVHFAIITVDGTRHSVSVEDSWSDISSIPDANTIILTIAIPSGAWSGYTGGDLTITKVEATANWHNDGMQLQFDAADQYRVIPNTLTITCNKFYDIGYYSWSDTQGIHAGSTYTEDMHHLTFENNLISKCHGTGFQTVGLMTHLVMRNNTFVGSSPSDMDVHTYAQVDLFCGNIVEYGGFYMHAEGGGPVENATICDYENYNIFHQKGVYWWYTELGANDLLITDDGDFQALFTSYGTNDFTLAASSRAINFGNLAYAPSSDILGVSRVSSPDAGCYEYVSTSPAPVLAPIGSKTVNENASLTFAVSATGDGVTYSTSTLPTGATFASQTFSWTPTYSQAGTYQVTFYAIAGTEQDSETITITVSNVNRPPVLGAIGNKTVNEGSPLTFTITATDADNDPCTYSAQNLPTGATLNSATGVFSWTPNYDQAGIYNNVTFIASDGTAQDSETITITVNNVNRPPVLSTISNRSVNEGSTVSFSISASDADSQAITYSAQSIPTGATLNTVTGAFTWTPAYNQAGAYPVTFVASDSIDQDTKTATITVNNVNRAPVLGTIGNQTAFTGTLLTFTVSATDLDNDSITYSAGSLPSGATFNTATGAFSWTPAVGQTGTYQLTFTASDGQLQDSETVTITVTSDTSAPTVTAVSPAAGAIQVPLNNLINLSITDAGTGVDAASVTISLNGTTIYTYTGDPNNYTSASGRCSRIGTSSQYTYIYQSTSLYDFGRNMTVTVNASDLGGNAMNPYSYSFDTEMRLFGQNIQVSSTADSTQNGAPAIASDSTGSIWAAWHAGQSGTRGIYLTKRAAGAAAFGSSARIAAYASDQCNPAIAIDADNKLYVAWQDNRLGNWDIYVTTSTDAVTWTTPIRVTGTDANQTNPAVVVDAATPRNAYIAYQDDAAGNEDIYIVRSSNGFSARTLWRVTSDAADQAEIAAAVDASNKVYLLWTDLRNGHNDIYGASSAVGPWTNVAVVTKAGSQSAPALKAENAGSILHMLWVDDTSGNKDIYYASSSGLPGTPLTGTGIIDTAVGDQIEPAIAVSGSAGNNLKVFACWQDKRNALSGGDTDLYFYQVGGDSTENIFVGDDGTNSNQTSPAMAVDANGYPYLVWIDGRNAAADIYTTGNTFFGSAYLASADVSALTAATVGTPFASIAGDEDVSVTIPAGSCEIDVNITISKVENPPKLSIQRFSIPYEFGPSGMTFSTPVTITIPYNVPSQGGVASVYWYNLLTGLPSQQGITNVETSQISPTLYALRFQATHFTQFFVGESILGGGGSVGGGGGGGGCSLSRSTQAGFIEYILPYLALAVVMVIIKLKDVRSRAMRKAADGN
jgi:hypothetical protein